MTRRKDPLAQFWGKDPCGIFTGAGGLRVPLSREHDTLPSTSPPRCRYFSQNGQPHVFVMTPGQLSSKTRALAIRGLATVRRVSPKNLTPPKLTCLKNTRVQSPPDTSVLSSFRFPRVRGEFELKKLVEVTVGTRAGAGHERGGGGRREVVAEGLENVGGGGGGGSGSERVAGRAGDSRGTRIHPHPPSRSRAGPARKEAAPTSPVLVRRSSVRFLASKRQIKEKWLHVHIDFCPQFAGCRGVGRNERLDRRAAGRAEDAQSSRPYRADATSGPIANQSASDRRDRSKDIPSPIQRDQRRRAKEGQAAKSGVGKEGGFGPERGPFPSTDATLFLLHRQAPINAADRLTNRPQKTGKYGASARLRGYGGRERQVDGHCAEKDRRGNGKRRKESAGRR
ncbi:hypothetical protein ALC62_03920 [Cyphomyrmex costatus]|uniref:Uncharacterized protein n=1 Tax=Cyphomyrmex costatus TaxID=456900 RepID=A0A195CWU3_9HYME|nr:hypothetical protein ALC62_03920 [Cyphomyrmex costatus]